MVSIYIDINKKYTEDERNAIIEGNDAIIDSVENIFSTPKGSRFFNRGFGSNLRKLMFEPITSQTASAIIREMDQALIQFEPRVRLILPDTIVRPVPDQNMYFVTLVFEIKESQSVITRTLILQRGS